MTCEQIQDRLSDYLDENDPTVEREPIARHLALCPECSEHLAELKAVVAMLKDRKAPPAPPELMGRIHEALALEPAPERPRLGQLINWPSLMAGAVAAGLIIAIGSVVMRTQAPLPTIQTAAVSVATPMAVNIGFDVDRDVENVTYTIDLPDGLEFVDADNQAIDSSSISWEGSLRRGKTVVPITVRGVQPGRYEILATVRKNQFARTTKIVVPVEGREGALPIERLSTLLPQEG